MTFDQATETIPVRLDFDAHAPDFSRAMAHLDRAATKELDRAAQRVRLLHRHAHQGRARGR